MEAADPLVTEQPGTPLVIEHDERTVDQGQTVDDGPSELAKHKESRGYTKPPVKEPEPPPLPDAAAPEQPQDAKPEKKNERLQDPDTGDIYDMRHKVARRIKSLLDERGLTREEVKRLRQENEEYRKAVLQGRAPAQEPPKPPTADADPEPDPADTAKYPEGQFDRAFMRDMGKWAARQETKQYAQTSRAEQEQQQRQQAEIAAVSRWQQTLPETRKRYPDFDAVIERIPNTAENAPIVQMMLGSPVGNDVVYVLGTQEAVKQQYDQASPYDRMRLLHHIEATLIQHQRAAAAKQPPRTTNAPPPTSPVQTGPAPGVIDWSKTDDPDQYARWKAQRSARR